MTRYEGRLTAPDGRFAIVISRFNELITERLLSGAHDGLRRHGVSEDAVDEVWVPGSFEIPLVARRLAAGGGYAAIICLSTVIRGETAHFEYVAGQTASGIASSALETGVPVIFGVLTTETLEQAMDRSGAKAGNKGYDAAVSAIEMVNLLQQLP